jgi:hypothetical protein
VALRTDTSTDEAWRRALETAIAVAYMRPLHHDGSAWAFPVQELHAVQALCYDQKERFLTDAAAIHVS